MLLLGEGEVIGVCLGRGFCTEGGECGRSEGRVCREGTGFDSRLKPPDIVDCNKAEVFVMAAGGPGGSSCLTFCCRGTWTLSSGRTTF